MDPSKGHAVMLYWPDRTVAIRGGSQTEENLIAVRPIQEPSPEWTPA